MKHTLTRFLTVASFSFLLFSNNYAQEITRDARLADYDALVSKLEANYAGWETKVTSETRAAFEAAVAKQRPLAGEANSDEAFLNAARGLLAFFVDGHLSIHASRQSLSHPRRRNGSSSLQNP